MKCTVMLAGVKNLEFRKTAGLVNLDLLVFSPLLNVIFVTDSAEAGMGYHGAQISIKFPQHPSSL
jgi:hypothetical protein